MQASELTFGIEIECFAPRGANPVEILRTAGVEVRDGIEYNHRTIPQWKVVTDGSLRWGGRDAFYGYEIVSPVLQGADGIAQVRSVMMAIEAAGFKVNATCGLHAHVGIGNATAAQVKNLAKMYLKYANEFDQLMPASRRGVMNMFCKNNRAHRFANSTPEQIDQAFANVRSINGISELMNGISLNRANPRSHERYYAFNMLSYVSYGTIEFRQHSGTVNHQKACEWIKLLTGFVASAFSIKSIRCASVGGMAKLMRKTDREGRAFYTSRAAILNRASDLTF